LSKVNTIVKKNRYCDIKLARPPRQLKKLFAVLTLRTSPYVSDRGDGLIVLCEEGGGCPALRGVWGGSECSNRVEWYQ